MLIIDIETLQFKGGINSVWEFAAIDTYNGNCYHWINAPIVQKAGKRIRAGYSTRFFEWNQFEYTICNNPVWVDNDIFFKEIQALINQYSVISAYNVNFDYRELKKQGIKFKDGKLVCLWGSFINAFVSHKYVKYCFDNGFVSEKGNIQTSAEIAYRYLADDSDYVHQHTALADCISEKFIWDKIKGRKQKLESGCSFANVKKRLKSLGY